MLGYSYVNPLDLHKLIHGQYDVNFLIYVMFRNRLFIKNKKKYSK